MDGKQLKNSILQWAIQGKLVPQNPKDEPAQKLLERIAAARNEYSAVSACHPERSAKGTKSKDLKKKTSKNPPSRIYRENGVWYEQVGTAAPKDISDEIPFEIPENWAWARWGELSDSIQYGYNAPALQSGRIKMVRISDIHDNKIEWDKVPYCQIKESEISTYLLQKNDILFARTGGTVGKSYLVSDVTTEAVYAGYLIRTRYNFDLLSPQYLKFFMESSLYWEQLREGTIATAQPNCNGKTLGKMLLPLPPLAEQKRIVAKLEQVLPLAEEYGAAQEQLDKLNKELPEALKKSILQEAIQGKLVPQNPKDDPAQKLLEKIALSRHSERSEDSNKRSKKTSKNHSSRIYHENGSWYEQIGSATPKDISDEIPFEIPETWIWCRMGDIIEFVNGRAYKKEELLSKGKYKVLRVGNFFTNQSWYFSDLELPEDKYCYNGDLLYAWSASFGPQIWNGEKTIFHYHIWNLKYNTQCLYREYLYYFFLYDKNQIGASTTGSTMVHVSMEHMIPRLIPIPPLSEQKRIVKKIEELYKVIDSWH